MYSPSHDGMITVSMFLSAKMTVWLRGSQKQNKFGRWILICIFIYRPVPFQEPKRRTTRSAKAAKKKNDEAAKDVTTCARVEGNKNADDEEEDVCPICLDPPLHPVELEVRIQCGNLDSDADLVAM